MSNDLTPTRTAGSDESDETIPNESEQRGVAYSPNVTDEEWYGYLAALQADEQDEDR